MKITVFLLKRFLFALRLLFLLPLLTFFLMHLLPGNYFQALRMNPQISPEVIRQYEAMYHLDQPVVVQYLHWVKNLFQLNLGYSFAYRQPVTAILQSRLWNTFLLTGVSFLIAWMFAVIAGLLAGRKPGGWFDRFMSFLAYMLLSVPGFFAAILLVYGGSLIGLPAGGIHSYNYEALSVPGKLADLAAHMAVPVGVLALGSFAYLFRIMRGQTAGTAGKDFVFYLRANRIPEGRILFSHVFRNAVNPMITLFGLELPALFSGAALIEILTGWPGLGQVMLQAVRTQDIFLVMGNMVMVSLLLIAGNLLSDVLLAAADPRTKLAER